MTNIKSEKSAGEKIYDLLHNFSLFEQMYYVAKPFVYPMVEKIGFYGCGFVMLILDIFNRFYSYHLPISISALRYIFIVQNQV
jgi:hypothetical protein